MTLPSLSFRNLLRNRFRTALTMLAVAVAVLGFMLLRTVVSSWQAGVEYAAQDRVGTRHKVSFTMTLPKRYADDIRQVPGVKSAVYMNWFGGKDPRNEREFFGSMAVEGKTFFEVYDEVAVSPAAREAWMTDRKGAIVGDVLARKLGWKVGDKVTLLGTIYPGNWEFHISGIYQATRRSMDRSSFYFHWDYLNESLPVERRDQIGWVVSRVGSASEAAGTTVAIDKKFDDRDIQTISMSERALNNSFMGMLATILQALDIVSVVILFIMALILGNTIAMGVRERQNELAVLRAIGFQPPHLSALVLGEAAFVGLVSGGLGVLLSYPLIQQGLGRFIEENMGAMFPYFRIAPLTVGLALGLSMLLAVLGAIGPALRAARVNPIDALRRVE
jgi:putative ABC transport system permease protein